MQMHGRAIRGKQQAEKAKDEADTRLDELNSQIVTISASDILDSSEYCAEAWESHQGQAAGGES